MDNEGRKDWQAVYRSINIGTVGGGLVSGQYSQVASISHCTIAYTCLYQYYLVPGWLFVHTV